MRWLGVFSAAAVLSVGCGEVDESAVAQQSIVYGQLSGQADDAVVYVLSPGGSCSGALIAPNLVLTARHCLAIFERGADLGCNQEGTSVTGEGDISSDYEPTEVSVVRGPGGCAVTPNVGKRFFSTGSQTVCRNDLAIIELVTPMEDWPILPLRLLRPTSVGERMTIVGFGQSDNPSERAVRRRREDVSVLTVGANRFNATGGMAVAGTFVLGQGACKGDSGGPAIAESSGAIAGVYSIKAAKDCTDPDATGVYVQIAEYYDLIFNAFDEVGVEPWLEGERNPSSADKGANASGCAIAEAKGTGGGGAVVGAMVGGLFARRRVRRSRKMPG